MSDLPAETAPGNHWSPSSAPRLWRLSDRDRNRARTLPLSPPFRIEEDDAIDEASSGQRRLLADANVDGMVIELELKDLPPLMVADPGDICDFHVSPRLPVACFFRTFKR